MSIHAWIVISFLRERKYSTKNNLENFLFDALISFTCVSYGGKIVHLKLETHHTGLLSVQTSIINNFFAYLRCNITSLHCVCIRKQEQLEMSIVIADFVVTWCSVENPVHSGIFLWIYEFKNTWIFPHGSSVSHHIHTMDGALIHCSVSCLSISLVNAVGFFHSLFLCLPLHSSQTLEREGDESSPRNHRRSEWVWDFVLAHWNWSKA